MPNKYEVIENDLGTMIKKTTEDGIESWVPMDESNSDYQAYLKYLEETNAN